MRLIFTSLILILLLSCSNKDISTVETKTYIDEVLKTVEENSIRVNMVDFAKIKRKAYAKLRRANTIKKCHPIVESILEDLGDRHSFLLPKEEVDKWLSTSKTSTISDIITFKGKLLDQNIGYIHMEGFGSGDSISIQQYADSLQNLIKSIDNINIKGWILDLRENNGGNCWPMLTGLGPLLGDGVCGYFIGSNQSKTAWVYKDGAAKEDSTVQARLSINHYDLIKDSNPIAVLTGNYTASSGEIVTTAFCNKSNSKSFGESTMGLSTANDEFKLSDGSMIFLTTSTYADRKGNIFGHEIEPNQKVSFSYKSIGSSEDSVIKKAIEWIEKK